MYHKTTNKLSLPLLHLLDGVGQADGFHGYLDFADASKEICDEDTSWVPEEKVSTVAWSGHTLTLGTHFELGKQTKYKHCIKHMQHWGEEAIYTGKDALFP